MEEKNNIPNILKHECSFWDAGYDYVIGADEVGRGCIAGPIVTAAVVWDKEKLFKEFSDPKSPIHKIRDSKKITKNVRYKLSHWILENSLFSTRTEIQADIIDEKGIQYANRSGMAESIIKCFELLPHGAKVVAFTDYLNISKELEEKGIRCIPILHGDNASLTIASASIVAKVHRDAYMSFVAHEQYPQYGFNTHVGYGTKKHMDAIKSLGLTPLHRSTFIHNVLEEHV